MLTGQGQRSQQVMECSIEALAFPRRMIGRDARLLNAVQTAQLLDERALKAPSLV